MELEEVQFKDCKKNNEFDFVWLEIREKPAFY